MLKINRIQLLKVYYNDSIDTLCPVFPFSLFISFIKSSILENEFMSMWRAFSIILRIVKF